MLSVATFQDHVVICDAGSQFICTLLCFFSYQIALHSSWKALLGFRLSTARYRVAEIEWVQDVCPADGTREKAEECEQGFDLPGRRLGGYTRQPPLSSLRQSALAAAENRAKRGSLLPSGPRRIGGDSNMKSALSPIQAAAMAAERRMQDDLWCASRSSGSNGVPETSKSSESVGVPETIKPSIIIAEKSPETSVAPTSSDAGVMWQCGVCTLSNQSLALICEACGNPKHDSRATKKQNVWSCKFCTLNNSTEVEKCLACGEWRYSYGAPAFSRGPYVGT